MLWDRGPISQPTFLSVIATTVALCTIYKTFCLVFWQEGFRNVGMPYFNYIYIYAVVSYSKTLWRGMLGILALYIYDWIWLEFELGSMYSSFARHFKLFCHIVCIEAVLLNSCCYFYYFSVRVFGKRMITILYNWSEKLFLSFDDDFSSFFVYFFSPFSSGSQ